MISVHIVLCTYNIVVICFFFFFSSRRRHTRCSRDWSSDVCSSDLIASAAHTLHTMIADGVSAPPLAPIADSDTARIAVAPAPNTETGNILGVDDNAANREMLSRRLTRAGHRVQVVANGPDALTLLRQQPIHLVLLDVLMPQTSGHAGMQRLTAEEALREIPVLMISALDEMDSVVRCIELGAEDYLPKPFDPVLLRARIGACLEKKRRSEEHTSELQSRLHLVCR